jgi:hypothetical protein
VGQGEGVSEEGRAGARSRVSKEAWEKEAAAAAAAGARTKLQEYSGVRVSVATRRRPFRLVSSR